MTEDVVDYLPGGLGRLLCMPGRIETGARGRPWASRVLHCRVRQLKLVLGLHRLYDPQQPGLTFHIREAIKHPAYNPSYENDLALLKVRGREAEGQPRPVFSQLLTGPPVPTAGWTGAAQQKCPTTGSAQKAPSQAC